MCGSKASSLASCVSLQASYPVYTARLSRSRDLHNNMKYACICNHNARNSFDVRKQRAECGDEKWIGPSSARPHLVLNPSRPARQPFPALHNARLHTVYFNIQKQFIKIARSLVRSRIRSSWRTLLCRICKSNAAPPGKR